jgi:Flp pilus assembly protein TadG
MNPIKIYKLLETRFLSLREGVVDEAIQQNKNFKKSGFLPASLFARSRNDEFINKLLTSNQGLAAVEFALALPLLILLVFGSVEVTRSILITQKLERVSSTLSDVVSQLQNVTGAQMGQIITASGQVMLPYDFGADGYAIVSSITKTGTNAPIINWQYKSTGTVQASHIGVSGGVATMPSNFTMVDKDTVIVTEVFYNYKPILLGIIYNSGQLYRVNIYKPRLGNLTTLG